MSCQQAEEFEETNQEIADLKLRLEAQSIKKFR